MVQAVRLDEELVRKIDRTAKRRGVSRSELIRMALVQTVEQDDAMDGAALAAKIEGLIAGLPGSGDGTLSVAGRDVIAGKIRQRHAR